MKTILEIKKLKNSFGSNNALKDFSYEFKEKTIYALIGANGSGGHFCFWLYPDLVGEPRIVFLDGYVKRRSIDKAEH